VRVRQFRLNDLPEVFDIAAETLREAYSPQYLIDLHSYWPEGFIVLEELGVIQGFIAGILISRIHARMILLGVRGIRRRRGYGSMLCREFIKQCGLIGVRMITLEVRLSNRSAISLYRKMGFSVMRKIDGYYTDGEGANKMQLIL